MTEVALGGPSSGPIAGSELSPGPKEDPETDRRGSVPLYDLTGRNDPIQEPPPS